MKHPAKLNFKTPFEKALPGGYRRFSFRLPRKGSGIYVIKDREEIVYIGMSKTNIQKMATRHFQTWNCKRQYRVSYSVKPGCDRFSIAVVVCNPYQAFMYEDRWIRKLNPRDNIQKNDLFERKREERQEIAKKLKSKKTNHKKPKQDETEYPF